MVTGLIECYNSADGQRTIEQIKNDADDKGDNSAHFNEE